MSSTQRDVVGGKVTRLVGMTPGPRAEARSSRRARTRVRFSSPLPAFARSSFFALCNLACESKNVCTGIDIELYAASKSMADALVDWPSAPLTDRLVKRSLKALQPPPRVSSSAPESYTKLIQWSTYDSIDHEATHEHSDSVLSSSFVIRKALIRKHYLARCIHNYLVKHPESSLKHKIPRTWDLEISFADELDEKWSDDLWDLGQELDASGKWWILKPGMADRGMGIRLFNSKSMLEAIFQEFEDEEDEEEGDENDAKSSRDTTAIVTSQLRHFVIQVCLWPLSSPLHYDYQRYIGILVEPTTPRSTSGAIRRQHASTKRG
jgi:hypothetical protein